MIWFLLVCVVPSFVLSCLGTAAMRRLAPRWGLIDQPAARKVHVTPTPLGGGLGIFFGFVATIGLAHLSVFILSRQPTLPTWLPTEFAAYLPGVLEQAGQMWRIVAAGAILVAMGLLDDGVGLPWPPRLVVQFLVAAIVVSSGVHATLFVSLPWVGTLFTIFWIVLLINSINFLDNMDALSSGIGLIASSIFALVMLTATSEPRWLVGGSLLVLAGSIAGFLVHNWPPAKIFMGDAGSTFLGMMLATMTIRGTFYDSSSAGTHVILAPICVLAVPLYDFASVMWIRLSQGRSPFQPDKSHFSHRLVELGLTRKNAVLTVHLVTLMSGLGALLLYRVSDWTGAAIVLALVVCIMLLIAILESTGRRTIQQSKNGE
ncbi:MraY family glycosyltransferase [Planctomyces sp. SH-PL14]|jgi:UDP-GlcNAc:undecaprenyl-phosphate GlcNAc-1-phosphate transferase|uniref:MraY family glycosyltransferase n=1 Tax=Planctomyces sp. SH-PL14 TaxID=1632864 RepID=UPI00078CCC79|nr:MraY family glycosyltransferase [Planctomyces sp. SH-PL14]AMV18082.1 putative undecaprenyl-phosphate N-acetylglucosaminyl 1-phosphate transferase [Planctomyces sp. SH-PL14]